MFGRSHRIALLCLAIGVFARSLAACTGSDAGPALGLTGGGVVGPYIVTASGRSVIATPY
jgi:hypothetical protein